MERSSYGSIQQMVASLRLSAEPVTHKSGAVLRTPVPRPDWMLNNDDIELQLKIGSVRVSFSVSALISVWPVKLVN